MRPMRPIARLRAQLGGYFWKPCPRCGRMFGGHEVGGSGKLDNGSGRGSSTCPRCPAEYVRYEGATWRISGRLLADGHIAPVLVDPLSARSGFGAELRVIGVATEVKLGAPQ